MIGLILVDRCTQSGAFHQLLGARAGQVRKSWEAWPELLHDAADSGLTNPMGYLLGSYRIATASSRTPAGSRAMEPKTFIQANRPV